MHGHAAPEVQHQAAGVVDELRRAVHHLLQHRLDALVPTAVGEYLHKQLKGSTLEVLDVTGHCAHMSHPHLVTAAMQRYLSPA